MLPTASVNLLAHINGGRACCQGKGSGVTVASGRKITNRTSSTVISPAAVCGRFVRVKVTVSVLSLVVAPLGDRTGTVGGGDSMVGHVIMGQLNGWQRCCCCLPHRAIYWLLHQWWSRLLLGVKLPVNGGTRGRKINRTSSDGDIVSKVVMPSLEVR